ncbi:hypothetical protein AM588_10000210 [Phytophthora nicotianae]|nr:hypothetical protein AM588_10000210 [Phytophthora nicotianae]
MLRKDGVPVSGPMLEMQALEIAAEHDVLGFKASWHWRKGFLRIFFEIVPKQTVTPRGSKTVWVRHGVKDKERVTVMLLADLDGNKSTPFLDFKVGRSTVDGGDVANWVERRGFGVHIWKEAQAIMEETGMELYGNPTAWWNSDVHMEFLKVSFGSRPRPWQPAILLVDDFSGHWTPKIEAYALSIDVHLLKVPPSCTSTAQPADIAWNRPFKSYLRRAWVSNLQEQLRKHRGSSNGFSFKAPNRTLVAEWVKGTWDMLSRTTIMNGFRKAHILSPLPSTCEAAPTPLLPDIPVDMFEALKRACLVGDKDKDLSSDDDLADDSESDGEDNE